MPRRFRSWRIKINIFLAGSADAVVQCREGRRIVEMSEMHYVTLDVQTFDSSFGRAEPENSLSNLECSQQVSTFVGSEHRALRGVFQGEQTEESRVAHLQPNCFA